MKIVTFIKNWTLPISMVFGVLAYFVYVNIHALDGTHQFMNRFVGIFQPLLIFCMLFLSFCRVRFKDLKLHGWQWLLLLMQVGAFLLVSLPVILNPEIPHRILYESAMICFICPTATAAAVVTVKLHGNANSVISYTCLINLVASVLIPTMVSFLHSGTHDMDFFTSFTLILSRVFPLLIMPLFLAFIIRKVAPRWHRWFESVSNSAFYLWTICLALAIAITTKALVHSHETMGVYIGIAVVSAMCCVLQFVLGRRLGRHFGESISGAQSFGQKNTAFAIWMAYTFMNPVTSLAGGFYCIWHNVINSYQLWKERKVSLSEA